MHRSITVSADGHFLMQPNGEPFFWLGDTAWELFHRLKREEADLYLQVRARQGFNVIQVTATGKVDPIGLDAPNRYGEVPFISRDPARPNERYFQFVDWLINRAAQYGIRVALLPVWGQSFVSGTGEARVFTVENAKIYGRWLGARYRDKGVIWVLGGDVTPLWPSNAGSAGPGSVLVDFRAIYDAMASGIEEGAGKGQFFTYHPPGGSPPGAAVPRTSLYFADRDWLDMNMIQSSHFQAGPGIHGGGDYRSGDFLSFIWNGTFNYLPVRSEYDSRPARPIIDAEACYESHPIYGPEDFKPIGLWQPHHVRGALYKALFAGAAGHTYGHFSVWDFFDPARAGLQKEGAYDRSFAKYNRTSWQAALSAPGGGQMQFAKRLMLSRPYFSRIPDQSLIVGDSGSGSQHIAATRDRSGAYGMVYVPQGQPVTIDLSTLSGSQVVASWFDPRTGKGQQIDKQFSTKDQVLFQAPTRGEDQDWILLLDDESRGFVAPEYVTVPPSLEESGTP